MRAALRHARLLARRLTAHHRLLPHFLVIGAQRAGTTSFYDALTQHPLILPALVKEVNFFALHYGRGPSWYRAHFPLARAAQHPRCITGESTPYYLFDPRAPDRVHSLLPDVRLLVLLRDPVDRAWSHYLRERRMGREGLSFEEAIDREGERLASEGGDFDAPHHRFHSYLARGAYSDQLDRWLERFPREQLLVLRSECFYSDPKEVIARVQGFLDLPAHEPERLRRLQEGGGARLDPRLRARLRDHFTKQEERLCARLGSGFRWSG
jgi:hypothetical protein